MVRNASLFNKWARLTEKWMEKVVLDLYTILCTKTNLLELVYLNIKAKFIKY